MGLWCSCSFSTEFNIRISPEYNNSQSCEFDQPELSVRSRMDPEEQLSILRGILNNDGSRRAFIKFLQKKGLEGHLNYFFEVEDLVKVPQEDILKKASELQMRYNPSKIAYCRSDKQMLVWETIASTLPSFSQLADSVQTAGQRDEIIYQFKKSQQYVSAILVQHLDAFLVSPFYQDWEREQLSNEKATLHRDASGKAPTGRAPCAPSVVCHVPASLSNAHSTKPSLLQLAQESAEEQVPSFFNAADHFPRVLVVDDSTVAAKIACQILEKSGHKVVIANHGRTAIELMAVSQFDVVLVDLYMPIMDGFETLQLITQSRRSDSKVSVTATEIDGSIRPLAPQFPVVLIGMSADNNEATVGRALDSGANYFMLKPFSKSKFSAILWKNRNGRLSSSEFDHQEKESSL